MKWFGDGLSACSVVLAIAALSTVSAQGPDPGDSREHNRVIQQYCVGCHSDRSRTGGLSLESLDAAAIPANADTWEKVVRKLRAGAMPPAGIRRPDETTSRKLIDWLEDGLDRAAADHPAAGFPAAHRLNRAEYANAVRDLLGLDVPRELLPPADDSSFGFDNIADQLRPSPALLERYVSASDKISAMAIGNRAPEPVDVTYRAPSDLTQTAHLDGLPLGTRGGLIARHIFPADGEYVIKPKLWRSNSGFLRGMMRQHQMEISVDGARVHLAAIGGPDDFIPLITLPLAAEAGIDARTQVRLPVKAGPRAVAVTFVEKSDVVPLEILQPFQSALDPFDANGLPQIDTVTITGPFHPAGPGDTPSRRRIFVCYPKTANDEVPCASDILRTLARRAYRRPVNDADLKVLRAFYEIGRKKGGFEEGIRMALRRLLAESEFIFRFERTDPRTRPGRIQPISDLELASSLSFFLWSSIPDDELLREAIRGRLHRTEVLDQQARRMIADRKSRALVDNFAGQWLYLRNLQSVAPDRILFPDFDDNLRQALGREVELFFESIVREDRSVLEFLTGDYTFLNERLARHYGLPDVHGSRFRRVRLTSADRYGLLGKGAILMVTSHADRTSPVLRGKWILDNLLGAPPSAPPAGVPVLKQNSERPVPLSMRAQMEEHRSNATCATCHQVMDPLGFALENFDAVGAWRTSDAGVAIDASDRLTDGTEVNGPASLQRVVKPELFVRTLTEKLLTYGLGRGLTHEDAPTVRAIVKQAARDGYRFSSLLSGVVHSVPFRMRTAPPPGNPSNGAAFH